nr:5'-3' exonuclease PLD4 isoform X2 [Manis javanica]
MDVQVGPPEVLRPLQRTSVAAVWPYCTPPHSPQEREASMVLGRLALLWLSTATLTYLLWQVHPPSIWAQTRPAVRPARLRASGPRPAWEPLLGKARQQLPKDSCRLVLVESIPQDLPFAAGSPSAPPLAQAWPQLLDAARESIHMASFYWSLTGPDIGVNDSSSRPVCPGPRRQLRPQAVQPGPVLGTQQVGVHLALTELWAVWGDLLGNVWVLRSWQGLGAETSLGACLTAGLALQGEALLQKLQQLLARNISLAVATSSPAPARKSTDLQVLAAQGAQVRYVPMTQLTGGVLHSKFWIVDGKHIYLGSANMDWRSLTQVKELGAVIYNCSRLAQDLEKTFQTYWVLGAPKAVLPKPWPQSFSSHINRFHPFQGQFDGVPTTAYFSASPLMLCPHGRTQDLDALLAVIGGARVFIYAEVLASAGHSAAGSSCGQGRARAPARQLLAQHGPQHVPLPAVPAGPQQPCSPRLSGCESLHCTGEESLQHPVQQSEPQQIHGHREGGLHRHLQLVRKLLQQHLGGGPGTQPEGPQHPARATHCAGAAAPALRARLELPLCCALGRAGPGAGLRLAGLRPGPEPPGRRCSHPTTSPPTPGHQAAPSP